ncbi:hypothetical protein P9744_14805, partial [Heyndrickxia coagulans]|nr:hypothetical protein [Heyndrickxia coagulans]
VLWVHYIGSGIVGAAGAFLLVPIMLVVLKTPTRMTIASQCRNEYVIKQTLTTGGILLIPIVGRIRRSKDRRKWVFIAKLKCRDVQNFYANGYAEGLYMEG